MASTKVLAWHWIADTRKLRDGKPLIDGKLYSYNGRLFMCNAGLHASRRIWDALEYAPGPIVCRVECFGRLAEDTDKLVCSRRRVLWSLDATTALHIYARWCASQVLHLWDAPDVVKQYLATGDDWIRAAARDAAGAAAWGAAWDAAGDAAKAAAKAAAWAAAWDAARDAAWDAAGDAAKAAAKASAKAAAWASARAAAWASARAAAGAAAKAAAETAQNAKLEELIMADREKEEDH